MNRLWVRLTLAFGLVTLVGVVVAALLANYQLSSQFRRFAMGSRMSEMMLPSLVDYYARHGSWEGVETMMTDMPMGGMGMGRGAGRSRAGMVLTDTEGQVIYDGASLGETQLNRSRLTTAYPIQWQGQTIGYLLAAPGRGQAELTGADQAFLNQINRTLLQAGLIAGSVGVVVGLLMARGVTAPLQRLATAARRIAQGALDQQVEVNGATEISELAQAFNEMTSHLREAETLRRNLVADVAHELRTPLSVIRGNLQAILDDIYPLEKSEIAGIYEETVMLQRLIDDLRQLAQAEAGQLDLNLEATPLAPLIEETIDLFRGLAQEKEIELTIEIPPTLPPVRADGGRLRQVLHNLLTNALRHTPNRGKVSVVAQYNPDSQVQVSILDTGPGIPAQDIPHLFERFWRADKARSRDQSGSGLGLTIARQLIEAQQGQIGVDSQPEQGSRFWFTLPVKLDN